VLVGTAAETDTGKFSLNTAVEVRKLRMMRLPKIALRTRIRSSCGAVPYCFVPALRRGLRKSDRALGADFVRFLYFWL